MMGVPSAISNFQRSALCGAPPLWPSPLFGWHGWAEKSQFLGDLRPPPGYLGPLLDDHLVTMGVCINMHIDSLLVVGSGPKSAVLGLFAPQLAELR